MQGGANMSKGRLTIKDKVLIVSDWVDTANSFYVVKLQRGRRDAHVTDRTKECRNSSHSDVTSLTSPFASQEITFPPSLLCNLFSPSCWAEWNPPPDRTTTSQRSARIALLSLIDFRLCLAFPLPLSLHWKRVAGTLQHRKKKLSTIRKVSRVVLIRNSTTTYIGNGILMCVWYNYPILDIMMSNTNVMMCLINTMW